MRLSGVVKFNQADLLLGNSEILATIFSQEMNMKITNMKLTGLWAGIILTLTSFGAYAAEESHVAQAIQHTQTAIQAPDGKAVAEHAEVAKTHAKASVEHLNAAITNLDGAIEHGKAVHDDLAKKAAEEALAHLKAAQ